MAHGGNNRVICRWCGRRVLHLAGPENRCDRCRACPAHPDLVAAARAPVDMLRRQELVAEVAKRLGVRPIFARDPNGSDYGTLLGVEP